MSPHDQVLTEQLRLALLDNPTEEELQQLKALNARCYHVLYIDGEPNEQSLKNMRYRLENPDA